VAAAEAVASMVAAAVGFTGVVAFTVVAASRVGAAVDLVEVVSADLASHFPLDTSPLSVPGMASPHLTCIRLEQERKVLPDQPGL
jgi:hypothetical protein